jgi:zinc transport system ATP-binding protein
MNAGETLVIAGDNGSGKSTLLKVILGIHPLRSGIIEIDGKPWEAFGGPGRRIGYMNQIDNSLKDPVSAEEVVAVGLSGVRIKKDEADYKMELAMRRTGCFHLYGRNFHSLSGGEKQKVSLARCLCQEPGIFLMDEPTSFLDSGGREDFIEIINEMLLVEIPTVIIVTHDRELINSIKWPVKTLKKGILCDELPDY